ncbi:hypothetical protein [Streptomyces sp. NPDC048252]|uniref:hypothetical protein n=1 Tax=Streptomyces sp. NPDC048252 TaxID=3154612 RepID=UPI00341A22F2
MKQQVQDQAAAEHSHWLRQQRSEAYEQFEDAYNEASRLLDLGEDQDISTASGLVRTLHRWSARIEILGPQGVAESAGGIVEVVTLRLIALTSMHRMESGADGVPDEEYRRIITDLAEESRLLPHRWREYHQEFVSAAQQVMGSHQSVQ